MNPPRQAEVKSLFAAAMRYISFTCFHTMAINRQIDSYINVPRFPLSEKDNTHALP
ncbi:hypothetical protein LJPFL01_0894 [Lelliottia jeotgali]|nr:hypothetical protein LJPFL01_0894 [Lelliottia jeotgali]